MNNAIAKQLTGEKYIYYSMAYQLAKNNNGKITIGNDNNRKGGQKYVRWFSIHEHKNTIILTERKTTASNTDYSRYFRISEGNNRLYIYEYINEDGENCSKKWEH